MKGDDLMNQSTAVEMTKVFAKVKVILVTLKVS